MWFYTDIPDGHIEPLFWVCADESDGHAVTGLVDAWTGEVVNPETLPTDTYEALRRQAYEDNGIGYEICRPHMALEIQARTDNKVVRTRDQARKRYEVAVRADHELTWEDWVAAEEARAAKHSAAPAATV
jgi:hypothetical protein